MAKGELKQPIVDEIKELLTDAQAMVLVDYRGLTVEEDTNLRRGLREGNVIYKVYKNTLIKRAIEGTEFEAISELLDGPTAVAVSKEDATAPARILNNFSKELPELEFKGGVVAGEFYDAKMIKVIATIPSREELLSKMLGSIKTPVSNFARVLKQIADKDGAQA